MSVFDESPWQRKRCYKRSGESFDEFDARAERELGLSGLKLLWVLAGWVLIFWVIAMLAGL